jgi:hypothetical protein
MTTVIAGAGRKTRVLPRRGVTPPFSFRSVIVKDLSVFIDESGDFGEYEHHSPFYIVTLVFHNQSESITENISHLDSKIRSYGMPDYTIHTGPLIRREDEFFNLSLLDRKRIFNAIYNFTRTSNISYYSLVVEKKQCVEDLDLVVKLTKQLSAFLNERMIYLTEYDRIICYYDYGQRELTHILVSVFNTVLNNVDFKKVAPANYKLFQATDLLCTMELISLKAERKMLSKSELTFFSSSKAFEKSYLRAIKRKRL